MTKAELLFTVIPATHLHRHRRRLISSQHLPNTREWTAALFVTALNGNESKTERWKETIVASGADTQKAQHPKRLAAGAR